jgi:hypothetical protein
MEEEVMGCAGGADGRLDFRWEWPDVLGKT